MSSDPECLVRDSKVAVCAMLISLLIKSRAFFTILRGISYTFAARRMDEGK